MIAYLVIHNMIDKAKSRGETSPWHQMHKDGVSIFLKLFLDIYLNIY